MASSACRHAPGATSVRATALPPASLVQGQRRVREVLRALQDPEGGILQAPQGHTGGRGRLPQVRLTATWFSLIARWLAFVTRSKLDRRLRTTALHDLRDLVAMLDTNRRRDVGLRSPE